jgi:hypothetical protein
VRTSVGDPHRLLAWASPLGQGVHHALAWGSRHTGLPVVVVAAIALVVSFRLARQAVNLAIQVAVVAALLVLATRVGWVRW